MIDNNHKTSLLIPSQLPEFIRDNPEYENFVLFLQAYYQWMEQTGNVTDRSKNVLTYKDIDRTTDEFLDYYSKDFLPYFPAEILADKRLTVKVARELYKTKGTIASYKFLFRVLYNSDFEYFNTEDAVLKPSSGEWYVERYLNLATTDTKFLNISDYRIFGETSKAIARIEASKLQSGKTQVYISHSDNRTFQSGEYARVIDQYNRDVYISGVQLRAKIVGQVTQIVIDPSNSGLNYHVGDPVIVSGGLNSNTSGTGAIAEVESATTGSLTGINVLSGGFGYVVGGVAPNTNTQIVFSNYGSPSQIPVANVISFDTSASNTSNAIFLVSNTIGSLQTIKIGENRPNANIAMANSLAFIRMNVYPIGSVQVTTGGVGIDATIQVRAESTYPTQTANTVAYIRSLGILAPVQIANTGSGYAVNQVLTFTGGNGYGANAIISAVNGSGGITAVSYVAQTGKQYPLGGMGYTSGIMPVVAVTGAGTGASLYVPGILGTGAQLGTSTDSLGSIKSIKVVNPGQDYVSTPNVSLIVEDIITSNVNVSLLPQYGDIAYQGSNVNVATYIATVNSISQTANSQQFILRVFDYNSYPNTSLPIKISNKNIVMDMVRTQYNSYYDTNGVRVYGDGSAKATAIFLNGLATGQGYYLSSKGHPSSYSVLQSQNFNKHTYKITVEKEIAKYRDVLLKLLHPSGMKVLGRYSLLSTNALSTHAETSLIRGNTLYTYTQTAASNARFINASFTNPSSNVLQFNNLSGANISNLIYANSTILLTSASTKQNVSAGVLSVNSVSGIVYLTSNTFLVFPNIAEVTVTVSTGTMTITKVTPSSYNVINRGVYSNTAYPLMDIIHVGDTIQAKNSAGLVCGTGFVTAFDAVAGTISYSSTGTSTNTDCKLSILRNYAVGGTLGTANEIKIFGPVGTQYIPELTDESGNSLTTESGYILILG